MSDKIEILSYDHIKIATNDIPAFERSARTLGFSEFKGEVPSHFEKPDSVWGSGEAIFAIYSSDHPLAKKHFDLHGDTVFDLSFVVANQSEPIRVESGVGEMRHTLCNKKSFKDFPVGRGITRIDHNTLNVDMKDLEPTVKEYLSRFNLEKGQYFDISTGLTGLHSWVTRTPNTQVQIPFNEASEPESQVQEYIDIHKGPGVQHLALLTNNIIETMDAVRKDQESNIEFLDIPDTYYELVKERVKIKESYDEVERLRILADADETGYLLQIFTKNVFGGFFFELIQRAGNRGFGEGNFQALFESIELDQKRRGVL